MSAQGKMTAARTALVLEQPFFGVLALGLTFRPDPGCGTAWVDGRTLGYDPTFVESLSHSQATALVAHEVMHCALGHPWRRDGRNMKPWNVACDKAINHDLRESGFKLPDGALYAEGDEKGKSAEWIFARQPENGNGKGKSKPDPNGKPGQGKGQGKGTPDPNGQPDPNQPGTPDPLGEVRDAPIGPDDATGEPAPSEADWKQKVQSAMVAAKMAGKLPGGMARELSEALKPRIDIRSLLLRFFSERSTGDYSWTRPNSRYLSHGLYLPALESKALGEVAVFIDTSGSVDQTSLAYACGVTQSVIEECDPAGVTLYFADTKVAHVERLEKGDPLTWTPKGGGGTDFRAVFEAIDAEGTAVCAVCISDLEGRFPDVPPSIPVLWLATTNLIAPFGETVPLDR